LLSVDTKYKIVDIELCPVCNIRIDYRENKELPADSINNFYVKSLINDFNIDLDELNNRIKIIKCGNCYSTYYNKWFDLSTADKIFNVVYGQHHYGWKNYYNFVEKLMFPNHGSLFKQYFSSMDIKTYGEYNCPFSGLFFNILDLEYDLTTTYTKNLHQAAYRYFNSRQLAKTHVLKNNLDNSIEYLFHNIDKIKKANKRDLSKNNKIQKYLLYDSSSLCWGYNCISDSINCKSLAQVILGYDAINLQYDSNTIPSFDCFGLFMVLDHQINPMKLLNRILDNSQYVLLHLHTSHEYLTKQHLFSFSKDFTSYLTTNNIFSNDITKFINKDATRNKGSNYLNNQLYIICSKSLENIKSIA
tara:strand:- start:8168 stop:9244 length:1077 start_codon:yes stop_codon:yes gene_type:complete